MVSIFFQYSVMSCAASLPHISQSTESSWRAMKLSRLFAPPNVTFRISRLLSFVSDCRKKVYKVKVVTLCHISRIQSQAEKFSGGRRDARRSFALNPVALADSPAPDRARAGREARSLRAHDSQRHGGARHGRRTGRGRARDARRVDADGGLRDESDRAQRGGDSGA